jgi:hypothetical protein
VEISHGRNSQEDRQCTRSIAAWAQRARCTNSKADHPELAATRPRLERWSRTHSWLARVKAHDDAIMKGRVQVLAPPQGRIVADPNFDQVDAAVSGQPGAERAMNASPVVTKPSDVKALPASARAGRRNCPQHKSRPSFLDRRCNQLSETAFW